MPRSLRPARLIGIVEGRESFADIGSNTQRVISEINASHDRAFVVMHRLPGGYQEGAYELRERERRFVLKWNTRPTSAERLREAAAVVDMARAAGWPTPAWQLWGVTGAGDRYVIQDFVPGTHHDALSDTLLDELLRVNSIQAGLAPAGEQAWSKYAHDVVFADRHQFLSTVANSSDQGRELAVAISGVCAGGESTTVPDCDLTCGVFALENILFDRGRVSGVVDVGAIGRGSRVFDLSILYSRLPDRASPVEKRLRAAAEDVAGPVVFRICLAAEVLGVLFFGVTHWSDDLPRACASWTQRLRRLGPA